MSSEEKTNGRRNLGRIKRIVVKVGSAVIAGNGRLRPKVIEGVAHDVTILRRQGLEVILVVSGAVAAGYSAMGMVVPPSEVVERQAAASVGQHRLMAILSKAFKRHRTHVAQLLMTSEDIENRRRFISARHTLQTLIDKGIIPIINENDAISDDESKVGDNDHLAALVTGLSSAELLIVLSVAKGLHSDGGAGPVIPQVEVGSSIDEHIGRTTSASGVGGMLAKVSAARLASHWGVPTIVAHGLEIGVLPRLLAGEPLGTIFLPRETKLSARKQWIALRSRSLGTITVDAGAKNAVVGRGASLLPSGICNVEGEFTMGARVDLKDEEGSIFAVGLVSYSSHEIKRLQGKKQSEVKAVLGYEYIKEIINRDDMVLLTS